MAASFELGEGAVNGSTGRRQRKNDGSLCHKPDGKDWKDDNELLNTYEDALVFYNLCLLFRKDICVWDFSIVFQGPGPLNASRPLLYGICSRKGTE